jgi:hypothetical protein
MYMLAAASVALLGVVAWRGLPRFRPASTLTYGALFFDTFSAFTPLIHCPHRGDPLR